MPVIARRAVLIALLGCAACRADALSEISDLLGDMAAALADNNPAGFMKGFSRDFPGYDKIRDSVTALAQQAELTSSIEPIKNEGDDTKHSVDFDWLLQIKSRVGDSGPAIRREQVIHCEFVKEKKHWRIVSLTPIDFFAPAKLTESK